jgi:monoamine oxidase
MQTTEADVIVVGAGAAGLAAAARLARKLKRIVVLEARDRIGGRIWAERLQTWPTPVELGAEFVHTGNASMSAWLRRGKLKQEPVADCHWLVEQGRGIAVPAAWERIDAVMRRIGPRFRGSFGEWMGRHAEELPAVDRVLASTFVEGFHGAPLDRMSARTLYRATFGEEEQTRLRAGYGELVDTLQRSLPKDRVRLELGAVISRVQWRRGAVMLTDGARRWRANAALLTVPAGVLRARAGERGAIQFSPKLPGKDQAWRALGVGHALRIVLRLRRDVWARGFLPSELRAHRGRAFGFVHSDESAFPVWWSKAPHPVFIGWTGGPAAERMTGWTPERIHREARRALARLFACAESAIDRAVLDWRTHDWAGDPFTRGAYSFSVAGEEDAPKRAAAPVQNTLFFAGEATADALELGTVHGALASGERAAEEILAGW